MRGLLAVYLIALSALALPQFDTGSFGTRRGARTLAERKSEILRLSKVRRTSSLMSLIDIMGFDSELAQRAEAAFLALYDSMPECSKFGVKSPLAIRRSLGVWLADAYQQPGLVPKALRQATIRRLLAAEPKTSDPSKDFAFFGMFICGVQSPEPNLLQRLVAGDPGFASELLLDRNFEAKASLVTALATKSPSTLREIVPTLSSDRKAFVRAQAVYYIGFFHSADADALLTRAASDEYAIVRESVPRALHVATPETRDRLKRQLLEDPVEGVRNAAAADYLPFGFGA